MQDLIEVAIDGRGMRREADREADRVVERDSGREVQREGVTRGGRSVTVNRAESPLTWLRSRGLIDARQFAAGERLRAAYETASIAPSVTMRWTPRVDGGGQDALDPTVAQIAASGGSTRRSRRRGRGSRISCGGWCARARACPRRNGRCPGPRVPGASC